MSKIVISCIILAACLNFQEIQANSLRNSLLDNVQKVSDKVQNVITEGIEALLIPKNASKLNEKLVIDLSTGTQELKNGGVALLKDTSSCTIFDLFNKGYKILYRLILNFYSCLSNETEKIDSMTKFASDLRKIFTEEVKNALQCMNDSFNSISWIPQGTQKLNDLRSVIEHMMNYALALPNVRICYEKAYLDAQSDVQNLVNDEKQCFQSVMPSFD